MYRQQFPPYQQFQHVPPNMSQHFMMYHQPQPQQKQGLLAKLLSGKNRNRQMMGMGPMQQAPMMGMNPRDLMNGQYGIMHQQPFNLNQPFQNEFRMMDPQMTASATRAAGTANATGGIGSWFSNFFSNPASLMGNMEKVMQVANTVGPMVQQYGPVVKNIPSLIKMFTAINSNDNKESDNVVEAEAKEATEEKHERKSIPKEKRDPVNAETMEAEEPEMKQEKTAPVRSAVSGPKLYV
jgi:hypothetical protein